MYLYFQIAFLLILEGAQIIKRSFLVKISKPAYWFAIAGAFAWSLYLSVEQYKIWAGGPLAKYFLPPNRNIDYFIEYSLWKFWSPVIIILLLSLIFMAVAKKINRKSGEKYFEEGEIFLGATALFVVGYPAVIVYIPVFLLVFLLASIIMTVIHGSDYRTSLYYIWIISAIFAVIAVKFWISGFPQWNLFVV